MTDQIITKQCTKCKSIKPLSEFRKDRTRCDGYFPQCKVCKNIGDKISYREYRTKRLESCRIYSKTEKAKRTNKLACEKWRERNSDKRKAHNAVNNAIAKGEIPKVHTQKCKYCGKQAKEYHHPDHSKEHWFDIEPVCVMCHNSL